MNHFLMDIAEAILEEGLPLPVDIHAALIEDGFDLSSLTNPDFDKETYE